MRTTMRGVGAIVWLLAWSGGALGQPVEVPPPPPAEPVPIREVPPTEPPPETRPPPEERAPNKCGVDTFQCPVAAPVKRTTANGFSVFFEVDATFKPAPDPPYKCSCCEFRQEIKGEAFINGVKQRVVLVLDDPTSPTGTKEADLSKDTYQEDSRNYGSGRGRYGHRGDIKRWSEDYTKGGTGPDSATVARADGCHYHMTDAPGISGLSPGDTGKIDFHFRDSIVSVCPGGCDGCETKTVDAVAEHTIPKKCQVAAGSPEKAPAAAFILVAVAFLARRRRAGGRS